MTIEDKKEIRAIVNDYMKEIMDNCEATLKSVDEYLDSVDAKEKEEKTAEKVVIPNDKIILSADVFAKIINNLSFAQSEGVIEDGSLDMIFKDVQKNRQAFEKKSTTIEDVKPKKKIEKPQIKVNTFPINDFFSNKGRNPELDDFIDKVIRGYYGA